MSNQLKHFQADVVLALYAILTTLLFGFGYGGAGIAAGILTAGQFVKTLIVFNRLKKEERKWGEFYKRTLYSGMVYTESFKKTSSQLPNKD